MSTKTALDYFDAEATGASIILTPVATSPINGFETVDLTPDLIASAFRTTLNAAHAASEFRVATDVGMSNIVTSSGVIGALENWVVAPSLTTGEDFYWDVRYQNVDGDWSSRSTPASFTIPESAVQVPTNQTPLDADTNQTDVVTLVADAFASAPASVHTASQWQISTDNTFAIIDFDSGIDGVNLLSFTQAGVVLNETVYYWRVRYQSDTLGWSGFSPVFSFTTVNESVQKPTNLLPINADTDISSSVQLTGDSFTSIPGGSQTHTASQWQVGNSDFSTIYFDSGTDAINLESITATGLVEGTLTHYWRVRYKGDITGFSEWSTPFTFVTKVNFIDWDNWDGTTDGIDYEANLDVTTARWDYWEQCRLSDDLVFYVGWNGVTEDTIQYGCMEVTGVAINYRATQTQIADNGIVFVCRLTDTQAVLGYKKVDTTDMYVRVITVDAVGNITNVGVENVFSGGASAWGASNRNSAVNVDSTRFLLATSIGSDSQVRVCSVSGETVTFGVLQEFGVSLNAVASVSLGKFSATEFVASATRKEDFTANVITVTGTTVTVGPEHASSPILGTSSSQSIDTAVLDGGRWVTIVAYERSSNNSPQNRVMLLERDGSNNITISSETTITSYAAGDTPEVGCTYLEGDKAMIGYWDGTASTNIAMYGRVVEDVAGVLTLGTEIMLSDVISSTLEINQGSKLNLIQPGKVMATISNIPPPTLARVNKVLNGEP